MGFRFRRRITLFPGLRLNVSKTGVSATAGVRGASVTIGKRGVYRNLGIPGTGISHRERIAPAPGRSGGTSSPARSDGQPAAENRPSSLLLVLLGVGFGLAIAWVFFG